MVSPFFMIIFASIEEKQDNRMAEKGRYGIGLQVFRDMIERRAVYVDKTEYVYKLAHAAGKHFFLSRPRRFGKSLLISTLKAYFEGERELFKGLAIDSMETEWTKYPVIRLDLSMGKYYEFEQVHAIVGGLLKEYENKWNITDIPDPYRYGERLKTIIQTAYRQTGQLVVILVDEYDAPMLDSIHKPELQDQIRERIRDLFSPLKGQSDYLRFVFLTGISKFSQLSVFSELNNLSILTFDPRYEGICGITEEELLTKLKPDIEWLSEASGMYGGIPMNYDETVAELKRMYDGYHFSLKMTDIYNPWSLFYAFDTGFIDNYWFSTGTPSSLINLLKVKHLLLTDLEHVEVPIETFDAPTERISDPIPVLYQSGYLTIKGYNPITKRYRLGFPNEEVHTGFARSLYLYYMEDYVGSRDMMYNAYWDLYIKKTTFEQFLESVRKWYAGIPYSITSKNQNEQFYQSLFYALMAGVGADVSAEEQTSDGRMDIALKMQDAIYILEFKYGKTAEEAAEQVKRKNYAVRYAADVRPVFAVGLNVNQEQRTIDSYEIEEIKK